MSTLSEFLQRSELMRRLPEPAVRRRLREQASLSRLEVADLLGVSPTAIYTWETGRSRPGKRHIEAYVRLLDELTSR